MTTEERLEDLFRIARQTAEESAATRSALSILLVILGQIDEDMQDVARMQMEALAEDVAGTAPHMAETLRSLVSVIEE